MDFMCFIVYVIKLADGFVVSIASVVEDDISLVVLSFFVNMLEGLVILYLIQLKW
jgi:hypothetical protein